MSSGRLLVAARAVPGLGDDGQQARRDRRSALLATAEASGRQSAQGLLDVRQLPAGLDRTAQQGLYLLLVGPISAAGSLGTVVGQ